MTTLPADPQRIERALERLRQLAEGNAIAPESLRVVGADNQIYKIIARIELEPFCNIESGHYHGGVRGKDRVMLPSAVALRERVALHQKQFRENATWVNEAEEELRTQPGAGWGLDGAKIALRSQSGIFAATSTCPSCRGQKMETCSQCQGRRIIVCPRCGGQSREPCYNCGGSGHLPGQPTQTCPVCNGTRYAPCRQCQARGNLSCPTCQGRGGTPCPTCQATGMMTEEVALTCGAETRFVIMTKEFPSGLRRGLDRIRIENLPKGFADISRIPPPEADKPNPKDMPLYTAFINPQGTSTQSREEEEEERKRKTQLFYQALLPYTDIKMQIAGRTSLVGVFGKRESLIDVPPFLDAALEPYVEHLRQAAKTGQGLDDALKVRALRDALKLYLSGQTTVKDFRKIYPVGLSPRLAQDIVTLIELAVKKRTWRLRLGVGLALPVLMSVVFAALFIAPLHARMTLGWSMPAQAGLDFGILGLGLGAGYLAQILAMRWLLSRQFPGQKIALRQKLGKTDLIALGGIILLFIVIVFLAPIKSLWLSELLNLVN